MTLEQESEAIEPGIALADVESSLALFAEGIAGRYLHIRSNQEFAANPKLTLEESGGQNSDTLFLPSPLPQPTPLPTACLPWSRSGCASATP